MHRIVMLLGAAMAAALPVCAAEPPAAPPSDLDALSLADTAPAPAKPPTPAWRLFVEGAGGQGNLRGSDERVNTGRASFDARFDAALMPGLRGVLSDRLDVVHGNGVPRGRDVNTLREAYVSWAQAEDQIIDFGRVNVRHGAATGFNPTDWFKEGALRSVVSPDPLLLRENRQGTVVLQGQKLWDVGSMTAAFSPRLGDAPDTATFALNAGATNPRNRWLLAGSYKFSDKFNPELLLYGGADTPAQMGLNLSALVSDATVLFGEFSAGKGRSLLAQALGRPDAERNQRRAALGLSYTTGFNLTVTAEAEYNSAAPDREQWNALSRSDPTGPLRVLASAQTLQDLPVRRAGFVHAIWKDALVRRLDVSGFLRRDLETRSQAQWLEVRYHWERVDLAVQCLLYTGAAGSVYNAVPQRRSVELQLRAYL